MYHLRFDGSATTAWSGNLKEIGARSHGKLGARSHGKLGARSHGKLGERSHGKLLCRVMGPETLGIWIILRSNTVIVFLVDPSQPRPQLEL